VLGIAVDLMNYRLGLFQFNGENPLGLPLWLVLLWGMFSWYAVMMKPVIHRVGSLIIIAFSAIGGTLSYLAGARFGAVELPFGVAVSAAVLAAEWVLIALIIIKLSQSSSNRRSKSNRTA
jgi:hypothetical protein